MSLKPPGLELIESAIDDVISDASMRLADLNPALVEHSVAGLHKVVGGGGMKASHSVGRSAALLEKGVMPEAIWGASGATGHLSYMLARQYYPMVHIWAHRLSDHRFINRARMLGLLRPDRLVDVLMRERCDFGPGMKALDIDYLIDDIFRYQEPLEGDDVLRSPVAYRIASTCLETGNVDYFGNRQDGIPFRKRDDLFEAMRASKAMPVVYGRSVEIGGRHYADTNNSSGVEWHIAQAARAGARKVLAFDTSDPGGEDARLYAAWFNAQAPEFRETYRRMLAERARIRAEVERSGEFEGAKVLIVRPEKLHGGTFDNGKKPLHRNLLQGYHDTVADKRIDGLVEA